MAYLIGERPYRDWPIARIIVTRATNVKQLPHRCQIDQPRQIWCHQNKCRAGMAKIAALTGLLVLMASTDVRADPNYAVWRIAHERMLRPQRSMLNQ